MPANPESTFHTGIRDADMEQLIRNALSAIAAEITAALPVAGLTVFLGGGYGRGEGGVLCADDGHKSLYNDMDFFVFTPARTAPACERQINDELARIGETWAQKLGIDVDFCPVRPLSELARVARTQMFQDLKHGHVTVCGDPHALDGIPDLNPADIPFTEAARLLLNRGMGLLFAGEHLRDGSTDTSFIMRNLRKVQLGIGDAILMARGLYAWRLDQRLASMEKLDAEGTLFNGCLDHYRAGCDFKFRPVVTLPPSPGAEWQRLRDLWQTTVRFIANAPADAAPPAVARALAAACANRGENTLREWLRWCVRCRVLSLSCQPPVIRLLASLFDLLETSQSLPADSYPSAPPALLAQWRQFN